MRIVKTVVKKEEVEGRFSQTVGHNPQRECKQVSSGVGHLSALIHLESSRCLNAALITFVMNSGDLLQETSLEKCTLCWHTFFKAFLPLQV